MYPISSMNVWYILRYLQILQMKTWAKVHNINSSKDGTLNSLSIILLVTFHLQVWIVMDAICVITVILFWLYLEYIFSKNSRVSYKLVIFWIKTFYWTWFIPVYAWSSYRDLKLQNYGFSLPRPLYVMLQMTFPMPISWSE